MRLLDLLVVATIGVGLTLSASSVDAEDSITTGSLSRAVELPSHRWLAKIRRLPATELEPFTTDGCSGGMSSLWAFTAQSYPEFAEAHLGVPPWEECCVTHDRAYHTGGKEPDPEASYAARIKADEKLRQCVIATSSDRDDVLMDLYGMTEAEVKLVYEAIGAAMFQAVRLGGGPCTGLPWRWGYGYPNCWELPSD